MRKILALAFVIGMAVLVGGVADATVTDVDTADALPSGAKYDWYGSEGQLSLVGEPGTRYSVYDGLGNEVADGELDSTSIKFVAGNAGVGPEGVIVFVVLGEDVVAVTDPDWNWD